MKYLESEIKIKAMVIVPKCIYCRLQIALIEIERTNERGIIMCRYFNGNELI